MKSMLKGFFCIMLLASSFIDAGNDACTECPTNVTCPKTCPDESGEVSGYTYFALHPQHANAARKMVGVEDKIHLFGKEEIYGVISLGLQYGQTFDDKKLSKYFGFGKDKALTYGPTCDGTFDIYGVNFGTTSSGKVCIDPQIKNFVADIDLFVGWDEFICGLWTRIGIPINHTRWDLKLQDVPSAKCKTLAAGLVSTAAVDCLPSIQESLKGEKGFGDAPALKCGKVCGVQKETQVAGLAFDLGYDWFRRERGHLATSIHFVAPTGNRPTGEFLFEAVSGTGHMWELGGTINAGYHLWENCEGDQRLSVYLDAVITTLFPARQTRVHPLFIDGKSSALSQYLLLKKFNAAGVYQSLERAANVLCCDVKVKADVMADIGLMVEYDFCNFSFGIGWEFWVRSQEKLDEDLCCPIFSDTTIKYGIKGTTAVTNNDTQSKSTIGKCSATDASQVFLSSEDIDVCKALHQRALSNKVFGFLGYTWRDCEWQPYMLVEGGAEFGRDNKAVDQWEVMVKGGISF